MLVASNETSLALTQGITLDKEPAEREAALSSIKRLIDHHPIMNSRYKEEPGAPTRQKLVAAAIRSFGQKGYDGASIREIAEAAHVNIAGSPITSAARNSFTAPACSISPRPYRSGLGEAAPAGSPETMSAGKARQALKDRLLAMAEFILATPMPQASCAWWCASNGPLAGLQHALCGVHGARASPPLRSVVEITGDEAESEATKLAVFSLLGQILVFRIARAGALKRMGWSDIGARELRALKDRIEINVDPRPAGKEIGDELSVRIAFIASLFSSCPSYAACRRCPAMSRANMCWRPGRHGTHRAGGGQARRQGAEGRASSPSSTARMRNSRCSRPRQAGRGRAQYANMSKAAGRRDQRDRSVAVRRESTAQGSAARV